MRRHKRSWPVAWALWGAGLLGLSSAHAQPAPPSAPLPGIPAPGSGAPGTQEVLAWADFTAGILEPAVLVVLPDPSAPNGVWAAARGVLYFSNDGGDSWSPVGRFAARVEAGSDDDGDEFNTRALEQQVQEDAAFELADNLGLDDFDVLDDLNNLDFDLLFEDRLLEERFNRNLDGSGGGEDTAAPRKLNLPAAIAVAKGDPSIVFVAATSGLYRSSERGAGLRQVTLPDERLPRQVVLDPSGQRVLVGTNRGLLISEDGSDTWQEASEAGLRGQSIVRLQADYAKPDRVVALTKKAIFFSLDGGRSFSPTANTPPGVLRDVAQDPHQDGAMYAATSLGLFRSADDGGSWAEVIEQAQSLRGQPLEHVELSPAQVGQLYVATPNGEVFLSEDGGKRFVSTGDGLPSRGIFDLTADPTAPRVLWGALGEGLYRFGLIRIGEISERERRRLFDSFRDEPSADEVVAAALEIARLEEEPLVGLKKRAVLSSYMPRLRLQLTTFINNDQNLTVEVGETPDFRTNQRVQYFFTALTIWDFSRVANWGTGRTRSIERQITRKRTKLVDGIYKLYEERRALQLRLIKTPPATDIAYLKAELRLEEMTSLLDAKCGGYFSAAREQKRQENASKKE